MAIQARRVGDLDIAAGERSIFEQYRSAIAVARRSIYIENQCLEVAEIVSSLREALARGVEVVVLLPGEPEAAVRAASSDPQRRTVVTARAALGAYSNFTLAGLAGIGDDGERKDVYVHSKLMLIDDEWATIGSCNLHAASLFGNAEMNASFWDPQVVRALRCRLLGEHLEESTEQLDDVAALQRFGQVTRENHRRWSSGDRAWPGLAFSLSHTAYAP